MATFAVEVSSRNLKTVYDTWQGASEVKFGCVCNVVRPGGMRVATRSQALRKMVWAWLRFLPRESPSLPSLSLGCQLAVRGACVPLLGRRFVPFHFAVPAFFSVRGVRVCFLFCAPVRFRYWLVDCQGAQLSAKLLKPRAGLATC